MCCCGTFTILAHLLDSNTSCSSRVQVDLSKYASINHLIVILSFFSKSCIERCARGRYYLFEGVSFQVSSPHALFVSFRVSIFLVLMNDIFFHHHAEIAGFSPCMKAP